MLSRRRFSCIVRCLRRTSLQLRAGVLRWRIRTLLERNQNTRQYLVEQRLLMAVRAERLADEEAESSIWIARNDAAARRIAEQLEQLEMALWRQGRAT